MSAFGNWITLSGLGLLVVGAVLVWRSMDTRPPPRHLDRSRRGAETVARTEAVVPEQLTIDDAIGDVAPHRAAT